MNRAELQARTRKFHVDVLRLCRALPRDATGFETGKQLIRAAGSVGANYRAAGRAKSTADFIYKIEIVLEESDESLYWLEVSKEAGLLSGQELDRLIAEANELTAIFVAACNTSKKNSPRHSNSSRNRQSSRKEGGTPDLTSQI
ncbi:four helix bundle protein [Flaviaesturariibacter terrae]